MIRIFSELKTMVRDLVFGRPISKPNKNTIITVDIRKNTTPAPLSPDVMDTAMKSFEIQSNSQKPIVLPFEDPGILATFTEQNKSTVYKYLLDRMSRAIKNNSSTIPIFQLGTSDKLVQITKNNFETQLGTMMKFFVEQEDYESASSCRDLIKQIKSNE